MKLKGFVVTGVLALLVIFSGSGHTDASGAKFVPKTEEEKAWKEYIDTSIQNKLFETYDDSLDSFAIRQEDYTYHSIHAIPTEQDGIDKKTVLLLKKAIFQTAMKDVKTGDFQPGIFIKNDGSEAIFTFKSGNSGENHMYWYKPNSKGQWTLEKKEEKKGKKVEKLKLKNLKEFVDEYKAKANH